MERLKNFLGILLILLPKFLFSESSFSEELKLPIETGYETAVAWSRDSSKVAIGAHNKIYIIDGSTGEVVKTIPVSGFIFYVDWSPDGKKLAVVRKDEVTVHYPTDIWIVNVNDETMEKLTNSGVEFIRENDQIETARFTHYRNPRWSADGHSLIISVEAVDSIFFKDSDQWNQKITLDTVKLNLETRDFEPISRLPLQKISPTDQYLSPDGEKLITKIATSLDHYGFILKKQ